MIDSLLYNLSEAKEKGLLERLRRFKKSKLGIIITTGLIVSSAFVVCHLIGRYVSVSYQGGNYSADYSPVDFNK